METVGCIGQTSRGLSQLSEGKLTIRNEGQIQAFALLGDDGTVYLFMEPFNTTEPIQMPLDQAITLEFCSVKTRNPSRFQH